MRQVLAIAKVLVLVFGSGHFLHVNAHGETNNVAAGVLISVRGPIELLEGADQFSPDVDRWPAGNTPPQIAEYNHTAGPGESLTISGYRISTPHGEQKLGEDTRVVVYGTTNDGDEAYFNATVLRVTSSAATEEENNETYSVYQVAMITLPVKLPDWSTYMLWVGNATGWSKPVFINRTEAWWVGPTKARAGETVSVFGTNLAHGNKDSREAATAKNIGVYLEANDGTDTQVPSANILAVNPYKVDFVAPDRAHVGTYKIWVHNGHGGQYGWSDAGSVEIVTNPLSAFKTDPNNVGDVQFIRATLYKANGSYTDSLQSLIDKYSGVYANTSVRTVISLPAGTYGVNREIKLKSGVFLMGEVEDANGGGTVLKAVGAWRKNGRTSFLDLGATTNVGLKRLKFDVSGITLPKKAYVLSALTPAQNVLLDGVVIDAGTNMVTRFNRATNVLLRDSKLIGNTSIFVNSSQLFIDGTQFELTNNGDQAIWLRGSKQVSITNSSARDHDSWDPNANRGRGGWKFGSLAGWGAGRFIAIHSKDGSSENIYIGDNATYDLTTNYKLNSANVGEQILIEGPGDATSRTMGVDAEVRDRHSLEITLHIDPRSITEPPGVKRHGKYAPTIFARNSAGHITGYVTGGVDILANYLRDSRLVVVDGKGLGQYRGIKELTANTVEPVFDLHGRVVVTFTCWTPWDVKRRMHRQGSLFHELRPTSSSTKTI